MRCGHPPRFFGLRAFAEIYGIHLAFVAITSGLAPPLIGMLFDRTGSYNATLALAVVGQVIGMCLFMFLGPYRYAAVRGLPHGRIMPPAEEVAVAPSANGAGM